MQQLFEYEPGIRLYWPAEYEEKEWIQLHSFSSQSDRLCHFFKGDKRYNVNLCFVYHRDGAGYIFDWISGFGTRSKR